MANENEQAKEQAKCQLEVIEDLIQTLQGSTDDDEREALETEIYEGPLSVQVRSSWHDVEDNAKDTEYELLLCTGGPACRIVGGLGKYNEPDNAKLEYQDWFTPWIEYALTSEQEETLLKYARMFYYGD